METAPLISVLIPSYNTERYVGEAIASLLAQSFHDFECIILDDGSTDRSEEIILHFMRWDTRIRYERHRSNEWIAKTRNDLIGLARGKYIAFLDSDDTAYPERLLQQYTYMEAHTECGVCGSNFHIVHQAWKKLYDIINPESDEAIRRSLALKNPFWQNTVMIRKECFSRVWLYDRAFDVAEDLELWTRIGTCYQFHNIQEFLGTYRIHGENSIKKRAIPMLRNTIKIHKKMKGLGYRIPWNIELFIKIRNFSFFLFPFLAPYMIQPPRLWVVLIKKIFHLWK